MKKFITLFLVLLLLVGCSGTSKNNSSISKDTSEYSGEYFLNLLKEYEVREKNSSNTVDNEEFNEFLDKIFKETCEDSYIYMHYSISDYQSLGLDKPEVTLGKISYEVDEEDLNYYIDSLNELLSYDYDSLSYTQQYNYDMYNYSLLETICGLYYNKYSLLFDGSNQFASDLVTTLLEFKLYDKESVDDYLVILSDVKRYVDEAISFTLKQADNNLYHTDSMLDDTVDYLDTLIENKGSTIISTFNNNLEDLDFLSDIEKVAYENKVKDLVENDVVSSFSSLKDTLNTLYGKANSEDLALINIDKDYCEYMFIVNTSNNQSIDTTFENMKNYLYEIIDNYIAFYSNEDAYNKLTELYNGNNPALELDASDMLEYLRQNTTSMYEDLGDVSYTVSLLDTLSSSTLAYYLSPPLDNLNQNVIRVNENSEYNSGIEMYEVLAHEGFPGHLYQNIYYQKTSPHKFRSTQSFIGYTEGYADMADLDALRMLCDDEDVYNGLMLYTTTFSHIICSLVDISVNYYGYDIDDLEDFFDEIGLDNSYASYYYDVAVDMPTLFSRYAVGLVSHLTLRDKAKDALGDKFDYISYHDTILKNGPLPFNILEGAVDEYIEANK